MDANSQDPEEKAMIDALTRSFYALFTNTNQKHLRLESIYDLCCPRTVIAKRSTQIEEFFSLSEFIEPRKLVLTDGTLTMFEESEIWEHTTISGNIAQRHSKYKKSGVLKNEGFEGRGTKFFQFIKTKGGWKITSVLWEDVG